MDIERDEQLLDCMDSIEAVAPLIISHSCWIATVALQQQYLPSQAYPLHS